MNKLSYAIKSSPILYTCYYYVLSTLLRLLGLFCKTEDRLILLNSFGGKKYDDSPKAIYEALLQDDRFRNCKMVWALQEPDKVKVPEGTTVVKADTFQYFVQALKARVWITNSSMERGLSFKKKTTLCLNTWHGTAIKVMGVDVKSDNKSFRSKNNVTADIMLAQGQYDVDVFSHAFELPRSSFRLTGLPRNDQLANYVADDVLRIRAKLGIAPDKIVLLYAPTFREFTKGNSQEVVFDVPMSLQRWQDTLGENYVVLFRAHYEVAKHMKVDGFAAFKDVSSYPNLNELMIAADGLISDYSSIYFDFSITGKPMYCFAYDYDAYMSNRGMYLSLKDELPCMVHQDEDGLLKELLELQSSKNEKQQETKRFQEKYVSAFGHASDQCCDILAGELGLENEGVQGC